MKYFILANSQNKKSESQLNQTYKLFGFQNQCPDFLFLLIDGETVHANILYSNKCFYPQSFQFTNVKLFLQIETFLNIYNAINSVEIF